MNALDLPSAAHSGAGRVDELSSFVGRRLRWVIYSAFGLFMLAGLVAFKDYGLGWDDWTSRVSTGLVNWNYITRGASKTLLEGNEKYHGPAYELFLVVLEKILGIKDIRNVHLMRHMVMFLTFFLATVAFFRIARRALGHDVYALCAALLLVLSPRIFAEAIINSKDLAFLSFFIFSTWSLFRVLDKPSYGNIAFHAYTCGILVDIRLVGLLNPAVTLGCFLVMAIRQGSSSGLRSIILKSGMYLALCAGFVILFWPVLWLGPWHHFTEAFEEMRKYHWEGLVLYMGQSIRSTELPWHYLPYWILITTPLLYTVFFLVGIASLGASLAGQLKRRLNPVRTLQLEWVAIVAFFSGPLLAVILLHSVVYDGWRHVFCVYPFFILIAVHGIKWVIESHWPAKVPVWLVAIVLAINSGLVLQFMVRNHPHQNVYFNSLARYVHRPVGQNFELDYWGFSYRQGLEKVLELEQSPNKIRVSAEDHGCNGNLHILPARDRERIEFVADRSVSDYFLTNYRGVRGQYPPEAPYNDKVFEIAVSDIPIMGVYRMRPRVPE